jgi:hypothetical protein
LQVYSHLSSNIQSVKIALEALRGYSTHLNEQKISSQRMSKNQYFQKYRRVSILVGILGDQLLGPVVLPNRQTGGEYHRLLVNDTPVILELVHVQQRQHMWFMHDGASSHFLRIVK